MSFDKLATQVTTRRLASALNVVFYGLISVLLLALAGLILYLGILSPVFRPTPRLVFDLPTIESKQDYTLDLLVQENQDIFNMDVNYGGQTEIEEDLAKLRMDGWRPLYASGMPIISDSKESGDSQFIFSDVIPRQFRAILYFEDGTYYVSRVHTRDLRQETYVISIAQDDHALDLSRLERLSDVFLKELLPYYMFLAFLLAILFYLFSVVDHEPVKRILLIKTVLLVAIHTTVFLALRSEVFISPINSVFIVMGFAFVLEFISLALLQKKKLAWKSVLYAFWSNIIVLLFVAIFYVPIFL